MQRVLDALTDKLRLSPNAGIILWRARGCVTPLRVRMWLFLQRAHPLGPRTDLHGYDGWPARAVVARRSQKGQGSKVFGASVRWAQVAALATQSFPASTWQKVLT